MQSSADRANSSRKDPKEHGRLEVGIIVNFSATELQSVF